ncbi:MAG TPA: hypothetical protein PK997_00230 [Candidatus Omnitrophota bacterium]|nr:hypothetical protein [Candidatus Omnitrophota bacterium]
MRLIFRRYPLAAALFLMLTFFHPGLTWKKPGTAEAFTHSLKRTNGDNILDASIQVAAAPDCLLRMLFSAYHIRELMKDSADLVEIANEGPGRYELRSVHKNKLCSLDTVYRRDLRKDMRRVTFELIRCEQVSKVAPKLVSSKGYYEVLPDPAGSLLKYHEETRLEASRWDPRAATLVKLVERDTLLFLKKIKKYSEKTACRDSLPRLTVCP